MENQCKKCICYECIHKIAGNCNPCSEEGYLKCSSFKDICSKYEHN